MNQSTGALSIDTVNLKSLTVKYYRINVESMFSRTPFLTNSAEGFSYVKPYCVHETSIPEPEVVTMRPIRTVIEVPNDLNN